MKNLKVSLSSVLSYHIPVQEQRTAKAKRAQHGDNLFYAKVIRHSSNEYQSNIYKANFLIMLLRKTVLKGNLKIIKINVKCTDISASLKIISVLFLTEKEDFKGIQAGSQIMESSENSKVDCQVSEWSKWSRCESCRGYTISTRGTVYYYKPLLNFYSYRHLSHFSILIVNTK